MNIELDPIDLKIIALLKHDSRLTHKQIGQHVHRTGQTVGARIAQLMDAGIIKNYTITIGYEYKQFIQLFLNEQQAFTEIEQLVKQYPQIDECFKILGNGCYMIVSHFNPSQLNQFIEKFSVHDKFHRALVLSGFFFLKIASTFLNSSFFPKPIKRRITI